MKFRRNLTLMLLAGAAVLAGCKTTGEADDKPINLADLDTSVAPGDDFYQYANGGWLKKATIPEDRTRYGAFDILQDTTEEKVKDILFRAMERKGDTTDAIWVKVGDFFASGMDTAAIEAAGLTPIMPDIETIGLVASPQDIVREIARERSIGGGAPFYIGVDQGCYQPAPLHRPVRTRDARSRLLLR